MAGGARPQSLQDEWEVLPRGNTLSGLPRFSRMHTHDYLQQRVGKPCRAEFAGSGTFLLGARALSYLIHPAL